MLLDLFAPKEKILPDQWAVDNVVLDRVGKFNYKMRPFLQLPTRCMGELTKNCRVVLECSAQLSKTTALINFLGWISNYSPANTLFIMDSAKSVQKTVKNRIRPFLRDQAKVKALVRGQATGEDKSSSAVNISLAPGANLILGSARSASDLCSLPCQFVLCDEVSRFPIDLGDEGDPITTLLVRMLTYRNSMMVLASTPTTEDCTIHTNFLVGTQEWWGALCECGKHLTAPYRDIDFSDPENPTYACPYCGTVYREDEFHALKHCYSEPQNPNPVTDESGRVVRSFHVGATCTPEIYSWRTLRTQEIEARSKGVGTFKSFVNVTLGDVYYPGVDEALNVDSLLRLKTYFTKDSLPNWVKTITIGLDVQDNRFEYLVVGFSKRGNNKCLIERGKIAGDLKNPEVWSELKNFISSYKCTLRDGTVLYPAIICPDSGGHFTQDVYALSLLSNRIKPVKGYATTNTRLENSIIKHTSEVSIKALGSGVGRTTLTIVNTVYAKDIIRGEFLKLQNSSNDKSLYISQAVEAGFDTEFFAQMDSEIREETKDGRARWIYKGTHRNEMLDCFVYALTAFEIYRLATCNVADIDFTVKDVSIDDDKEGLDLTEILAQEKACKSKKPEDIKPEVVKKSNRCKRKL